MAPYAVLPATRSHSSIETVVSAVRCRIAAAALKHGATARAIPMQLLVAVPLAILWSLLAAAVPVYAQLPYWVGLVIISTVFLSRIVSQTSERQQSNEQEPKVLASTSSGLAAEQQLTPLSHEESIMLLLSTPGPFVQKSPAPPSAAVQAYSSGASIVAGPFPPRRIIAEDKAVVAAYVSGFKAGSSAGFCAGLATGLVSCVRKRQNTAHVGKQSTRPAAITPSGKQSNPLPNPVHSGRPLHRPASSSLLSHLDSFSSEVTEGPSEPQMRQLSGHHLQQRAQSTPSSWAGGRGSNGPIVRHSAAPCPLPLGADARNELSLSHISAFILANGSDRASHSSSKSNRALLLPGADSHNTTASNLLDPGRFGALEAAIDAPPKSLRAPDSASHARLTSRSNRGNSPRASSPASSVPRSREGHSLSVRSASARQPTGSSLVSSNSNSTEVLSSHSLQALCIEDEDQAQSVLQGLLEGQGWKVHHVRSGEEGLSFLNLVTDLPDIVIISQALKGSMDGLKVCSRIRERISACHLTIVIGVLDTDGAWVTAQAIENGADGVVVKPYRGPQVVHKLHTLLADIAETRLQQEAQEVMEAPWGTHVPSSRGRSSVPQEEDLLRLLPKSFQPQPPTHSSQGRDTQSARQSVSTPQQGGVGWLFATSAQPQQPHHDGKEGSGGGQKRSEARQQREQELEVEREWEEDNGSYTTASHRTDSTRGTLTPPHSSLEMSSGSASLPVNKVCFTSGWAGKPMIVDDDKEEAAASRGSDFPSSGDRNTKQSRTPHPRLLPTAAGAHNSAFAPGSRGLQPMLGTRTSAPLPAIARLAHHHQQVAVEEEEASNTLSFDCFAPPFRRCTSDSPAHADAANSQHYLQNDSPPSPPRSPRAGDPSDPVSINQSNPSTSLVFETNLGSQSAFSPRSSGAVFDFGSTFGAASALVRHANPASDHEISLEMSLRAEQISSVTQSRDALQAAPGMSGPDPNKEHWIGLSTRSDLSGDLRAADSIEADNLEASRLSSLLQYQHATASNPHGLNLVQRQKPSQAPPASLEPPGTTGSTPLQLSAAMLWAAAATAPEALHAPQAVPTHYVEYHQQRRQYQQVMPPPHQTQAVVMTSSLYAPSGFKAHPAVSKLPPVALPPVLSSRVDLLSPELDLVPLSASPASESSRRDRPSSTLQLQHWWQVQQQRQTHPQERLPSQLQSPSSSVEHFTDPESNAQHLHAQQSHHNPRSLPPQSPVFSLVAGGAPVVPRQPQPPQQLPSSRDEHTNLTATNSSSGTSNSLQGYPSTVAAYQAGRSSSGIVGHAGGSGAGLSLQEMDALRFSALIEGHGTQGSQSSATGSRGVQPSISRFEDATSLHFKALQSSSTGGRGSKERRRQAGSAWSEMPIIGT